MVIHFMLPSLLELKFHVKNKVDPMTSVLLKLICVDWGFVLLFFVIFFWFLSLFCLQKEYVFYRTVTVAILNLGGGKHVPIFHSFSK